MNMVKAFAEVTRAAIRLNDEWIIKDLKEMVREAKDLPTLAAEIYDFSGLHDIPVGEQVVLALRQEAWSGLDEGILTTEEQYIPSLVLQIHIATCRAQKESTTCDQVVRALIRIPSRKPGLFAALAHARAEKSTAIEAAILHDIVVSYQGIGDPYLVDQLCFIAYAY